MVVFVATSMEAKWLPLKAHTDVHEDVEMLMCVLIVRLHVFTGPSC